MPTLAGHEPGGIERAALALRDGALVAFPTETVYGLGARADDARAVARVFQAKGRPADHPLIVHLARPEQAGAFARELDADARRLMQAFWPGALTVIVPRREGVAEAAAGGHASIGLRCPSHPVAQALLQRAHALGVPGVAAPSANRFGHVSPTTAAHVGQELGPALLVLDGGACPVGIESAIVDCTLAERAVLLRPGMIGRDAIESVLGHALDAADARAARASGTLEVHYAPDARLRMLDRAALAAEIQTLEPARDNVAVYSRLVPAAGAVAAWRPMPLQAAEVARELFAVLREMDERRVAQIWVEQPPDGPEWEGVLDRLRRAAARRPREDARP